MAEFLDKIKENIGKGLTTVSVASKEFVETSRLKGEIAAARRRRGELIEELGSVVFVMMSRDALDMERVREKCGAVAGLDERIRALEESIRNVHLKSEEALGKRHAAASCSCGADIPDGSKFCGKCGKPVA